LLKVFTLLSSLTFRIRKNSKDQRCPLTGGIKVELLIACVAGACKKFKIKEISSKGWRVYVYNQARICLRQVFWRRAASLPDQRVLRRHANGPLLHPLHIHAVSTNQQLVICVLPQEAKIHMLQFQQSAQFLLFFSCLRSCSVITLNSK